MPQAKQPAMTSGPGAMSRRTDGGPASKQAVRYVSGMPNYGDGQELADLQASAPMSQTNTPGSPAPVTSEQAPEVQPIPIDAPSQRPGEPVTTGAAAGMGAGPEALNLPAQAQSNGMVNALALLNQLGDYASPQVKQIRNAIAAHLNNQGGNQ
jgi:hypothetical protein